MPKPRPTARRRTPPTTKRRRLPPSSQGRYTPPDRREMPSPAWVPAVMVALVVTGGLLAVLNYMMVVPGSPSPWYGVAGGAFALAGLLVATRWR